MINFFWRTRNVLARIRLAATPLVPSLLKDLAIILIPENTDIFQALRNFAVKLGIANKSLKDLSDTDEQVVIQQFAEPASKPLVFASFCRSADAPGHGKFNGGVKELNYLVKLLREQGYEAYVVTYDGSYESWLMDHQPHISMEDFSRLITYNQDVRCVTSWAIAEAFIKNSPSLYFWDMELFHTEHDHFPVLASLYRQKIRNTAAITRTIQAWHMAHFQRPCILLPNLIDQSSWFPIIEDKKPLRIGYMNEGLHTESYLEIIRNIVLANGLDLEFQQIQGIEAEVLSGMRSCEVFLGMNIGKDLLWGEGCPRTVIEALAAQCVVIAFDIIGNREIIQDNFNSILVPRYRRDLMAEALINLYTIPGELDRFRYNTLALMQTCHTFKSRWPAVKEFLHL